MTMNRHPSFESSYQLRQYLLIIITLLCSPLVMADYYSDAESYMAERKYNYAIIQLKNLLKTQPDHAQGRLLLGKAQLQSGQYSKAQKQLLRAKSLGTPAVDLALPMAHLALLQGQHDEVLEILTEDIRAKVDNPAKAQWLIGYAHLGQLQPEAAGIAFERSLQIRPSAPAMVGLAKLALKNQQADAALSHLQKAIETDPDYAEAWFTKGLILGSQGKIDLSIEALTRLLESHPQHLVGILTRAEAYIQTQQFQLATADVQRALTIQETSPMANHMRAKLHALNGDFPDAITSSEVAIKYAPNHQPSLLLLGSSHYAEGNYQQAKFYLEKAIDLQPDHWKGRKLLAGSHLQLGNTREALDILEQLDQSHDHQDINFLDIMGQAYFKLGEFGKGNDILRRIKAIDPDRAGINSRLALGEMALGNTDQALAFLQAANNQKTSSEEDAARLIRFYLGKRQWEQALHDIESSLKKHGKSARMLNLKSTALVGLGEPESARTAAHAALDIEPEYIPALISLGNIALRSGQYQQAKTHFQRTLDVQPDHLTAQMALATISLKSSDSEHAIRHLKAARISNPDALPPISLLVALYLNQGDKDKAIHEAKSYQSRHRTQVSAIKLLLKTYVATGKFADAINLLDELIALEPDIRRHRIQRVQLLARNKEFGDALTELETLLNDDPQNAQLLSMKSSIQIQSNQVAAATQSIQKLAQQFPDSHLPDQLMGDLKLHQNLPNEAYPYYQKAFDLNPSNHLLNVLVKHAQDEDQPLIAINALKTHLSVKPDDLSKRLLLGNFYLGHEQHQQALTEYMRVYEKQPHNPILLNNLAWLYWKQNDPQSLQFAEKAYHAEPGNTQITDTLGWITLHKGNPRRALTLLKQAASEDAFNPEIRYHLAVALHQNQETERASIELKRLLRDYAHFKGRKDAEKLLKDIQSSTQ